MGEKHKEFNKRVSFQRTLQDEIIITIPPRDFGTILKIYNITSGPTVMKIPLKRFRKIVEGLELEL